ncbi:MFS transporter [Planctomicrobium piriforme]|uniref:Major Facilitator Superfamily protein n=1 Tax=Planctomicrobium piriforme TaxID=1576369 RepID=A0A1I3IAQ5_9PLAN|nr:MFS transporter [Planctomicrobium piriforme]SFI45032.1 Major Facilitator Superfamily protein [Planctomicrobium piriforme]
MSALERPVSARWAIGTLFLLNGVVFANWAARIPAVQLQRSLANWQLGIVFGSLALGALVGMPVTGRLCARYGSDRVCRWCLTGFLASFLGLGWVPGLPGFFVLLFLFGLTHGALDVAMNAQAIEVERRYHRPIMSSFHALWSAGALLGATAGGVFAYNSWNVPAHFLAVAIFFSVLGLLISPRFLKVISDAGPAAAWQRPTRRIIGLGIVAFCVMVGEGAMGDWSTVYLQQVLGIREGLAPAGYAVFSVSMAVGRVLGDSMIQRLGPLNQLRFSGLLSMAGLATLLMSESFEWALVGFLCIGGGFATVVPIVFSAAGNSPGIDPGAGVASVSLLGYFGFLIGPPVIGAVAEVWNLPTALSMLFAASVLTILMAPLAQSRPEPAPDSTPA